MAQGEDDATPPDLTPDPMAEDDVSPSATTHLAELPESVLVAITLLCRAPELVALSQTCRRLHRLLDDASPVWAARCSEYIGGGGGWGEGAAPRRAPPPPGVAGRCKQLYLGLLHAHGSCLGVWLVARGPTWPFGGLLTVTPVLEEGAALALRAHAVLPDLPARPDGPLQCRKVWEVRLDDGSQRPVVRCLDSLRHAAGAPATLARAPPPPPGADPGATCLEFKCSECASRHTEADMLLALVPPRLRSQQPARYQLGTIHGTFTPPAATAASPPPDHPHDRRHPPPSPSGSAAAGTHTSPSPPGALGQATALLPQVLDEELDASFAWVYRQARQFREDDSGMLQTAVLYRRPPAHLPLLHRLRLLPSEPSDGGGPASAALATPPAAAWPVALAAPWAALGHGAAAARGTEASRSSSSGGAGSGQALPPLPPNVLPARMPGLWCGTFGLHGVEAVLLELVPTAPPPHLRGGSHAQPATAPAMAAAAAAADATVPAAPPAVAAPSAAAPAGETQAQEDPNQPPWECGWGCWGDSASPATVPAAAAAPQPSSHASPSAPSVPGPAWALRATKLTGDPNVPAGEVSLWVYLARPHPRPTLPVGSPLRLLPAFHCTIDINGTAASSLTVKEVYRGKGHVADRGFRSPRWVDAEVVVLSESCYGVLWHSLGSFAFYGRVCGDGGSGGG